MLKDKSCFQNTAPVIGVGVLVWREKKLLLGERIAKASENCWQFPGGHLENGESVIECARREVLEETSLRVKDCRHLGFTDKAFAVGKRQYMTLLVSCEYISGEAQTLEPDKCAIWKWFDYDRLPSPLFQPISSFLSQLPASQHAASHETNAAQKDLYALHCASMLLPDIPADGHR